MSRRASRSIPNTTMLEGLIEKLFEVGRIPGGALAVVAGGRPAYVRAFGYRDLKTRKPMTVHTAYSIASTTKPMNATLLAMLAEEGHLDWDAPVHRYLPHFRLWDAEIASRVTVRDLVTLRTGLPRHDWVWMGNPALDRSDLVKRFAHLEPSADFRQRFQYSNLTSTLAGHIAESVAGKPWEELIRERLFVPLGMRRTGCARPKHANVTLSYHENSRRQLVPSWRYASRAIAPAGGAVHSTISDMARWLMFNLNGGRCGRRRLIRLGAMAQLHAPQVVIGERPLVGMPAEGNYALGWLIDRYQGHQRLSHGGYLHDVNSSVMLFPKLDVGLVCFVNFGCARLAKLINQYAFDAMMGLSTLDRLQDKLADYETKIEVTRERNAGVNRISGTRRSQPLAEYAGTYWHAGYGEIKVRRRGGGLAVYFNELRMPLKHWHYDTWVAASSKGWAIHEPHPFDRSSPLQFHLNPQGRVAELSVSLEPEVPSIRFAKQLARVRTS